MLKFVTRSRRCHPVQSFVVLALVWIVACAPDLKPERKLVFPLPAGAYEVRIETSSTGMYDARIETRFRYPAADIATLAAAMPCMPHSGDTQCTARDAKGNHTITIATRDDELDVEIVTVDH